MSKGLLRPIVQTIWLTFVFAGKSLAGECDMQELLVQAHHLSKVFAQQRAGPNAGNAAKQLRTVLNQIPTSDLGPHLRAAGLSSYGSDISGFLRTQKVLVDTQILRGETLRLPVRLEEDLRDFSLRMQRLVPKLRCDSDETWRPENVNDGTSGTSPTGIQGSGNDAALISQNAAKISMVVFGVTAIVVGGSILLRRRAKARRRQARRLPCALSCTVSFLPDKRKGIPQKARRGRICDISQLGVKVCVDDTIPESLNDCNLYSHGWSTRGRVTWRTAQCMGIAFRHRLSAQDLYRLVRLNRKLHSGKKNGTP